MCIVVSIETTDEIYMKTYILIMVLTSNSHVTSFTQEFTSKESCTIAMNQIIADRNAGGFGVRSANCFEK